MPVFSDGQKISETEWARLIQSVPASYVVWKDGTATVIQAAIDALTNGGLIFFKRGTYSLSSSLIQDWQIVLAGEGIASTILDFSGGTSNGISTDAGNKRYLGIANLQIKMNNKVGILWQNVQESFIQNVRVLNPSIGLKISGNEGTASSCIHNTIHHLIVDNPSDAGIRLTGVHGNGQANGNYVQVYIKNLQGGAPVADSIGIDVDVGDQNIIWAHIQQVDIGVRFDNSDKNYAVVQLDKVTSFTTEVNFTANSHNNKVYGENFESTKISDSGSGNKVLPNYENSGTATIPDGQSSVTFAHGLAGTPTIVVLGATHSEVADAYVSAKDATDITITVPNAVSADREINWYAEYKP